ncbi:MAG: hypothetical protein WCG48_02055 [Candidatus Berkelbacteria bacterium]
MSNYLAELKEQYRDRVNIMLFISAALLAVADYILWHFYLADPTLFIYLPIQMYPVKLLFLIILINTLSATFSYPKEKEISYLLHIASIILALLTLALEIFYIIHTYIS